MRRLLWLCLFKPWLTSCVKYSPSLHREYSPPPRMSHQSRQTFIQNSCHPLTTIQNSFHSLLMGFSTGPRNPLKSAGYEKRLNFSRTVCATLSLCRVLPGARETRNPPLTRSIKSGLSTGFNDSAGFQTARRNQTSYPTLL